MCQACVDAVKKHWPDIDDKTLVGFLWECTPFPMGGPGDVAACADNLAERSGGDLAKAFDLSAADLEEAMRNG